MAINIGGDKGPAGKARVVVNKKFINVTFLETPGNVHSNERFDIIPEDAPSWTRNGTYYVQLSSDLLKIYSVRPCGGSHLSQFLRFAARENEQPAPRTIPGGIRTRSDGTRYSVEDSLGFTAILKILGGDYEGFEIPNALTYAFRRGTTGGTDIAGTGTKKLATFLRACGVNFELDTILYSENVLPSLERMLLENLTPVIIELNPMGYPVTIATAPSGMTMPSRKKKE